VSGGPFRFDSWEDDRTVFSRNPNYWRSDPDTGQQLPYLDRVEVGSFLGELRDPVLAAAPAELSEVVESYFDFGVDQEAVADEEIEAVERLVQQAYLDALVSGYLDSVILINMPIDEIADMVAPVLDGGRIDGDLVNSTYWELLGFNMGPGRLGVNEDSWNEYLDFRRAVAYALDRDRVATAAWGVPWRRLDSYVSISSPTLSAGGWDRYPYDPEKARELLAGLCDELGRDCEADPPRLVLSPYTWMQHRLGAAAEITAQLGEVGIEVETTTGGIGGDLLCGDYDVVQITFLSDGSPFNLVGVHNRWNPATPPGIGLGLNAFRWGTPAVEGIEDDPSTEDLDEATCFNSGPSAVIDEHTERMTEVLKQMRGTLDVEQLRSLIQQAEEITADQVVFIPLFALPMWWLRSTDLTDWGENPNMWAAQYLYQTDP
jgi:ABC-type transport system substrate-binding protein